MQPFTTDQGNTFDVIQQEDQTVLCIVADSVLPMPQSSCLQRIKEMSYKVRPLLLPLHFGLKVSRAPNDYSVLQSAHRHLGLLHFMRGVEVTLSGVGKL